MKMSIFKELLVPGVTLLVSSYAFAAPEHISTEESQRALLEAVKNNNIDVVVGTRKATATNEKDKQKLQSYVREGRVMLRLSPQFSPQLFEQNLLSIRGGDDIDVVKSFALKSRVSIKGVGSSHIVVVQASTKTTNEVIKLVQSLPGVEYAEPDYIVTINTSTPNDPSYNELWGLHNTGQDGGLSDADIDAPEAWEKITGSPSVVVGVIDTGVDYSHSDLIDNMWRNPGEIPGNGIDDDNNGYVDDIYGIDTNNNDSDPMDDNNHGTHVAGTIGATGNNGEGIVGVNQTVSIAACKFLSSEGSGNTSDAIECVDYFTDLKSNGINVVVTNNSWGGGGASELLEESISDAGAAGIVFAAAAGNDDGNDNDSNPHYPSSYESPYIVAVASTDRLDQLSSFSNIGGTSVDLGAPGSAILSTIPDPNPISCEPSPSSSTVWRDRFGQSNLPGWARYALDLKTPIGNRSDLWWQSVADNYATLALAIDDSPNGDYINDLLSTFTYQHPINLENAAGQACLSFRIKGQNEGNFDRLGVYITADGANWSHLQSIDADYATWTELRLYIPTAFKTANFRLALARTSDSSVMYDGYRVDDIKILDNAILSNTGDYASFNGTSMATPHVAGAIALAAAAFPHEDVLSRKNRVLSNVDPLPSLSGLVSTGGRLNVNNMLSDYTPYVRNDFNGDGKSDLVWRNKINGANLIWYMNGHNYIGGASLPTLHTNWELGGTNDLNSDGKPDLVWRNKTNGANVVWYMDNNSIVSTASLPSLNTNWGFVGTNDFNNDGKPDLVWRHKTNGANRVWYMDNNTLLSIATLPSLNSSWEAAGSNDFNSDGKPDLVFRHKTNGSNVYWYMDNTNLLSIASFPALNSNWKPGGTNDFNSDGKPDLVWRHKTNGASVFWYMNNTSRLSIVNSPTLNNNWEINGGF